LNTVRLEVPWSCLHTEIYTLLIMSTDTNWNRLDTTETASKLDNWDLKFSD